MSAYYNEIDPFAAQWLRELIKDGQIADGEVDDRSIEDVTPNDLKGFTQCHFFAGIGGWSLALRLAGWPDDRSVWTGSCPCQPFSAAGKRAGTADERHLWPAWFHLIGEHQPATIFGEQVDAAIKHGWLDLVQNDLEAAGYAVGHSVIPAAGVGAPHGRHRLWFVADIESGRHKRKLLRTEAWVPPYRAAQDSTVSGMANNQSEQPYGSYATRRGWSEPANSGAISELELSDLSFRNRRPSSGEQPVHVVCNTQSPTGGFWSDADWIPCRDGKWRPIEPGIFPLAHGVPARMDKLRGFGNAIVPQVAAQFIKAVV